MTAIPGIIMALYIFQAFLWVSSFYQNTMQRPCQRPPSEYRFCCVIISSVTQLCPTLCDPMDCSTPGFPVYHQLLELTQSHVHWVSDAIQPSCPLSSPSPAAFNLSQHQGLFQLSQFFTSDGQSIGVSASTSVLPVNTQDWPPLGWTSWISLQYKGLSRAFSTSK